MVTLCGFGVSNYYNKLKLILLEKEIPFREKLVHPWERDSFVQSSPLGKIPFIETDEGGLSESQVIGDYLEERYPERPLYPAGAFERAKCRELIQYLELNAEWVARRLYKEAFFGGTVSDETKREAHDRLTLGLTAVARLSRFSPYILGSSFTAADCAAYMHFVMIEQTTLKIYGENMLDQFLPQVAAYMQFVGSRPHFRRVMKDRAAAIEAFFALGVKYDG
jgi:glutathione S-transferase